MATAFPSEILRRDPVHALVEAGHRRLAPALASKALRGNQQPAALPSPFFCVT